MQKKKDKEKIMQLYLSSAFVCKGTNIAFLKYSFSKN